MPRSARDGGLDCAIVGGGLAGLAAAHELVTAGRSVHVVEAEEGLGGRTRSAWHGGRPVDVGLQVLLGAYPRTRALVRAIGMSRRDLRPLSGGIAVHDGASWSRLRAGAEGFARFGGLRAADRLRLGRLAAEVVGRRPEALLAGEDERQTTLEHLLGRGFGEEAIERFFRPVFGAMFLDLSLAADAGYFRFLVSMLARGPAVMPSDGSGMIAEWAAAAVRQRGGTVETGARAAALEPDGAGRRVEGVRLEDGRALRARQVVLAVDAPAARALLEPLDAAAAARLPTEAASTTTAAFALRRPLYRGRTVLVNGAAARGEGARVDLVCQTTNVTRPGAPGGPHILLATAITTGGRSADGLVEAVGELVGRWSPRFPWARLAEPIGVHEHPFARFRPRPGVRRALPGHRTALDNLILAGELTSHPSVEGAVASGSRAGMIVDALIA